MFLTKTYPTRKQIALDIKNGVISPHTGITLRGMIDTKEKEVIVAKKERENTNRLKRTYKELLPIIQQNIQYLKSSLGITEAHITWGNKSIKKYTNIKVTLTNKMREQLVDKRYYQSLIS